MGKKVDSGALPVAVRNFDDLPDSAEVETSTVRTLVQISNATYWRWVRAGRLPKPIKRGQRTNRTNVGELRAALAARAA